MCKEGGKMNLQLDRNLAKQYENSSQKMRKVTERWVTQNLICPYCGKSYLMKSVTKNADFSCPTCFEAFVLKCKNGPIQEKLPIGAYQSMFQKIESLDNPNFLFLQYNPKELQIKNLLMVPRYFFCVDTIERRQPLSNTTRRQGWVGCNILLNCIPEEGRIYIVENEKEVPIQDIMITLRQTYFMRNYKPRAREWVIDILNLIQDKEFTLEEICKYAPIMEIRYRGIVNAQDRIRKVLQLLRKYGMIQYSGNGKYIKNKKQYPQ